MASNSETTETKNPLDFIIQNYSPGGVHDEFKSEVNLMQLLDRDYYTKEEIRAYMKANGFESRVIDEEVFYLVNLRNDK